MYECECECECVCVFEKEREGEEGGEKGVRGGERGGKMNIVSAAPYLRKVALHAELYEEMVKRGGPAVRQDLLQVKTSCCCCCSAPLLLLLLLLLLLFLHATFATLPILLLIRACHPQTAGSTAAPAMRAPSPALWEQQPVAGQAAQQRHEKSCVVARAGIGSGVASGGARR